MWGICQADKGEIGMRRRVSEWEEEKWWEQKNKEVCKTDINIERKNVVSTKTREPKIHVGYITDGGQTQALLTEFFSSIRRWDLTCPSLLGVSLQSIIQYRLNLEPSMASTTKVHLVFECGVILWLSASICAIIVLSLSGRQMELQEWTFKPSQVWDKSGSHF